MVLFHLLTKVGRTELAKFSLVGLPAIPYFD